MAGPGGEGRAGTRIALIGFLGLVIGAVISGYFSYRGSNLAAVRYEVDATRTAEAASPETVEETVVIEVTRLIEAATPETAIKEKEVTRIVEVTREVVVENIVEVTRSVKETEIVEVTRIVEVVRETSAQGLAESQSTGESQDGATGGVIIGVFANDGTLATGTSSVLLYPKTLVDAAGNLRHDLSKRIRTSFDDQTSLAEAYALEPGRYVVCYTSPSISDIVGEVDIIAGEVIRKDFRWTADTDWGGGCDE